MKPITLNVYNLRGGMFDILRITSKSASFNHDILVCELNHNGHLSEEDIVECFKEVGTRIAPIILKELP